MAIIHSLHEFVHENGGKPEDYYGQWKTAKPEAGKVYLNGDKYHILIVGIVENVAVGRVVKDTCGGLAKGRMSFYHAEGLNAGWKYGDYRAYYRLIENPEDAKITAFSG